MKDAILKSYFSSDVRAKTWKKLSALLRNNVSELQALELFKKRAEEKKDPVATFFFGGNPLAVIFTRVIDEINKGSPLDVALYTWVPHEEVMLIRAGKKSANLPESLMDCVGLIEAKKKIMASVMKAIGGPLVMASLFIVLLLVVALYFVPAISQLSDPAYWGGGARILYVASSFVSSLAGVLALILFAGLVFGVFFSMPFWTGPLRVRFDDFPPWSIYRLMVGSFWLFTVATLMRANTSLDIIFKDMRNSGVLSPWLLERVQRISELYREDANFGKLLLHLKMNFPDKEMVEELAVYATMPNFHKNMYDEAKQWLNDSLERIDAQAQIINFALFICVVAALCGVGVAIGSIQGQLNFGAL